MRFKILEYKIRNGLLWDTEYPSRTIYSESIEVKVQHDDNNVDGYKAQYSWLSNIDKWQNFDSDGQGNYFVPLHIDDNVKDRATVTGKLVLQPSFWSSSE